MVAFAIGPLIGVVKALLGSSATKAAAKETGRRVGKLNVDGFLKRWFVPGAKARKQAEAAERVAERLKAEAVCAEARAVDAERRAAEAERETEGFKEEAARAEARAVDAERKAAEAEKKLRYMVALATAFGLVLGVLVGWLAIS